MNIAITTADPSAKPDESVVIMAGGGVPVVVTFDVAPPDGTVVELALSPQSSTPAVLAYLGSFAAQNATTYSGTLDASDTRLMAALSGFSTLTVNCGVRWTPPEASLATACPVFAIVVQPPIISGPETSDGGPTYVTTAMQAAALAPYAPLASPTLTGTPTAPTAAMGTNTTQVATMAAVQAAKIKVLTVANDAARLALTADDVNNLDQVKVTAPVTTTSLAVDDASGDGGDADAAHEGNYTQLPNAINGYPAYSNGPCMIYYSASFGAWVCSKGTIPIDISGAENDYYDPSYSTTMGGTFQAYDWYSGSLSVVQSAPTTVRKLYEVLDNTNLGTEGGWAFLGNFYLPPQNTAAPVVSGGSPWSTTDGTWDEAYTATYQWQNSADNTTFANIGGATASTYTPVSGDANKYLRCVVTVTNAAGSNSATSNSIRLLAPTNASVPTVSGTPNEGQSFACGNGAWNNFPASYSYQWQSSATGTSGWTNIGGATAASYAPVSGDVGHYLRVIVTATNVAGAASADSAASAAVTAVTLLTGLLAYYTLDETSGSRADSSGNGYDLTSNNSVGSTSGVIANAASFNGSNYLTGSTNLPQASNFAISTWMAGTVSGVIGQACNYFGYTGADGCTRIVVIGTAVVFEMYSGGSAISCNGTFANDGSWNHLVGTYDGANLRLYVNGTLASTTAVICTPAAPNHPLILGADWNGSGSAEFAATGSQDETAFYSRALTSGDVASLYNAGAGLAFSSFGSTP